MQKRNETKQNTQKQYSNTESIIKKNKANSISDTATAVAGAALVHKMINHKHDDIKGDVDDNRDTYDSDVEDLYDNGIDDYDYENIRASYEEEQAAYDDYIASLDMDD